MRDYQRQEALVRRAIRRTMARAVRMTNDALRLGVRIVQSEDQRPSKAAGAVFFLATRLLNDVRACELLAQTGYPLQSLAVAASAFELAYRALYIGNNESRAEAWAHHDDLRYSYPRNLKAAMCTVYRERGESESTAESVYKTRYGPIAAAKHANPKALAQFGLQRAGDTLHVFLGPVQEPGTVRACQLALVECVRLLGMVLGDLVDNHVRHRQAEFRTALTRLARRGQQLNDALRKP